MPAAALLIGHLDDSGVEVPRGRRAGVRGSVRETPVGSGRWQARWPRDVDLRQRPLADLETGEPLRWQSEAEARAELNRRLREIAAGRLVLNLDGAQAPAPASPPTVSEAVTTMLEEHTDLAPATRDNYRAGLRLLNNPDYGIGSIPITSLTTPQLRQWKLGLRRQGVSASMEQLARKTLSTALTWEADLNRWISESPATLPTSRRTKTSRATRQQRIDRIVLPTWAELHAMASAVPNKSDRLMLLFMAWTGARFSEAAAVEPGWLKTTTRHVTLKHTWQRETGGTWETGPLKTGEQRDVPVPKGLWARLEALSGSLSRPRAGHANVLFRPSYNLELAVIGVYNRWTWRDQVWEPMLEATGLSFTTRDLRAFAASLLADAGATHLEIGKVLGHDTPATTARYYTRATELKSQDPARLAIRAVAGLTYHERLDRLWAAWVRRFGDPTKLR